jgi:hypothetical protein
MGPGQSVGMGPHLRLSSLYRQRARPAERLARGFSCIQPKSEGAAPILHFQFFKGVAPILLSAGSNNRQRYGALASCRLMLRRPAPPPWCVKRESRHLPVSRFDARFGRKSWPVSGASFLPRG